MLHSAQALALVRIGIGLYFIAQALGKTMGGWLRDSGPMTQQIQQMGARSEGFYRAFIDSTVLPHAALVAQLVTIGEWVAGLSLALGLLTRVGALTGMLLVLNYMLLKGLPNVAGSIDRLFFVSCLGFLLSSAGLVWGLDGALSAALARLPVVNWCAGLSGARGRATAYSRS